MADPAKKHKGGTELELFDDLFPTLVEDISNHFLNEPGLEASKAWFKQVSEYNVPFGKKNRGVSVAVSFKLLTPESLHTDDNLRLARVLGWCVEWLQAYFLVADDIMDHSITRRGKPCWYKNENVGLIAVNDSLFLERAIYVLLKKYFKGKPYYIDLLELFNDTTYQTVIGQNLDTITAPENRVDFTDYDMERYSAIVKWKTAFYSFYLPVASAMYMAGINDQESHNNAKEILLQMGHFFQVQDDYLDCYGDPAVTGKIGTDIEDNKCGWLIVQALSLCDETQRKILQENYAQNDPEKVKKVKEVYEQLGMKQIYADYEESSYQQLIKLINMNCTKLPKEVFTVFADKIYKRNK